MATTTNYSWSTPDDTALVKDGAAAIRSLGTAIDTTVFTNAGAAINKSLVDAAGDLIYGTADNTVARLAIGTANQVLKVNSGATAPEWGTAPSGGMTLISTTTLTGASVTISSIPATYNKLEIYIVNYLPANDGSRLLLRMNADAAANRHSINTSGAFGATSFDMFENVDNAVSQSLLRLEFPNYANTTTWKLATLYGVFNDSTTPTSFNAVRGAMGIYNQTAAISSLQILTNAGNMTSGSVLLYGVK
jgi:hypothetical protein